LNSRQCPLALILRQMYEFPHNGIIKGMFLFFLFTKNTTDPTRYLLCFLSAWLRWWLTFCWAWRWSEARNRWRCNGGDFSALLGWKQWERVSQEGKKGLFVMFSTPVISHSCKKQIKDVNDFTARSRPVTFNLFRLPVSLLPIVSEFFTVI
jgi:hypothetical protein